MLILIITLIVVFPVMNLIFIDIYLKRFFNFYSRNEFFGFISFYISIAIFVFVLVGVPDDGVILKELMNIGPLRISWSFVLNIWFSIKLIVVTFITSAVQLDFIYNMERDPRLPKYIFYASLCGFFLLILLTGNNFTEISITWKS